MATPSTKKPLIIAIDGHSSCGKSTLAKDIAGALKIKYIDSGAMYRATTLFILQNDIDIYDADAVAHALENINISFTQKEGMYTTFLNGVNVESEIRKQAVANIVSEVAKIEVIRKTMVHYQRLYSKDNSIVMDGRDIGSVVLPHATLKIFLTATPDIRAERRYKELRSKGFEVSKKEVLSNLMHRDHIDSTRIHSPLIIVSDAFVIDNSQLSRDAQLNLVLEKIKGIK